VCVRFMPQWCDICMRRGCEPASLPFAARVSMQCRCAVDALGCLKNKLTYHVIRRSTRGLSTCI
jgi:hypothetical protein